MAGNTWRADVQLVVAKLGPCGGTIPVDSLGRIRRFLLPAYWPDTRKLRALVAWRACGRCHYCGAEGNEIDHAVPRISGGPTKVGNLVWSCGPCNRAKGTGVAP